MEGGCKVQEVLNYLQLSQLVFKYLGGYGLKIPLCPACALWPEQQAADPRPALCLQVCSHKHSTSLADVIRMPDFKHTGW